MPTRTRTVWKPRRDGQFDSRVGWKINAKGKRDQHRFRLGADLKEAKRRDQLLRQIWETIERSQAAEPLWGRDTLELAKQVADGHHHCQIIRQPGEDDVQYAQRVHELKMSFPMLSVYPEPEYGPALGVQLLGALERMYNTADASVEKEQTQHLALFGELLRDASLPAEGPSLHQAMKTYIGTLEKECQHPESGVTPWGRTQIKLVESLIAHHVNQPVMRVDRAKVVEMIQYWRNRPFKKGTKQRIATKSASNAINALRNFFKWLHTSGDFNWRKPEDFDEIKTRVVMLESERRTQVTPEQLFTLDELVLLYRYGTPLDRLLILLGLNCGFGNAESASLLVGEVFLRTPHSARHQEILDFSSTAEDSFIKRVRRKNRVYGEFLLFPQTVRGIEWALRRRRKQPRFDPDARLLLNGNGEPYDKQTKQGNANQQLRNQFGRLLKRITDDNNQITRLPFKMLRKTGGDLVKRFSDGEIKDVFLCHGQPVESDDLDDAYTSRPFGKVFHALRAVENHLGPMFAAGGTLPFEPQPQAYTPRTKVEQIVELRKQGVPVEQIAQKVAVANSTVYRQLERAGLGVKRPR